MALHPKNDELAMRRGVGFRFGTLWAVSLIPWLLTAASPGYGQPSGNRIIYSRQPVFRIPFETDAGERRLQEVQLYVSEDRGQTWKESARVPPEQRGFNFRAERDGLYWFTVRTVDFAGRANPATVQGSRPQLEVYVDTQPPIVSLRPGAGRDGTYAVEWSIREDNPDLSSLLLEYRLAGSNEWVPLTVEPALNGQRAWTPSTSGPVDVRLRVRDLAKNEGEYTIKLTPAAQEFRPTNNLPGQEPPASSKVTDPGKKWVNSKKISLDYEIKDEGPSRTDRVELWYTRDKQNWQKYSEDRKHKSPYRFEVQGEGIYGFTLLVVSGVGLHERPPQAGDPPQVWVEVDLTPPVVHIAQADPGRGSDSGNLTITWKATDKNFGHDPISLSYAKDPQGPWTPIASHIENSGSYRWHMPEGVPYRFVVRVEATDQAGNVGALASKPVIVDLAQPRGVILNVQPAEKDEPPPHAAPSLPQTGEKSKDDGEHSNHGSHG
jgi:hypothetical protein